MTWPTHLNPTQWTEDSSHLLHLPSLLLSHSQPARVPKAALRAPQGDQQQTPSRLSQNRGLTALCPQVNCPLGDLDQGSSGSWRSLTSQLSSSGLPCTFPPTPFANARLSGLPLQPGICSHNQGKKAAWRVHRIHGEAGAPPHRGFAHSATPRGRGQPGERYALRSSGQLLSRCRALGSVPLEEERRWYLLRKAFIRCDLVKVTIFTLLNYK